ncbi:hypothetical protein HYH03_009446 [Edaphochlamys debaryana]|uniref:Uncharacterized protein n=1 Tax=Edaphochlamys debaryana TaxID=47281 RepID=A0A835Y730_9CHLO|nr:hypothetical protein HYH03_009446 [Edaphochlamys debaryana]|eukprot:KAG2492199.1 hypothetical protein HYH03_009446 [Edaphochlamys debaryana]
MGVTQLWQALNEYDCVCTSLHGSSAEVVDQLCGKALAIDLSVWLFQCSQQSELKEAIYDEHARVLMIMLYRVLNLLRYGATPIFVLEGDTPEAKMGRLQQRSLAKGFGGAAGGNRRGGRHDALGRKVVELLDLLGVPHVDAPGEAEAMCAALAAAGLADAVVTSDVDCLLFGAPRAFKECRVNMDTPRLNTLELLDAREAARRAFGLTGSSGCVHALRAVAVLAGCDYSVGGGRGVGIKLAMEAVQQLTVKKEDDAHVLPQLLAYLQTGPDPRITALTKCTGCKTCGHEKHGRGPCADCGPGPCRPKAASAGCACAFHRSEPQRKFMRVISRASATGSSFLEDCRTALAAFEDETRRATRAAAQLRASVGAFRWSRRPDVEGVYELMQPLLGNTSADPDKLIWTSQDVRDKLRPVLIEWDLRQGPRPTGSAAACVEFIPRRIKQLAAKDGANWAYLVEFDRSDTVNPSLAGPDRAALSDSRSVKARHVRCSLVQRLWPQLLAAKEEEAQAKEQAKLEKAAKPKRTRKKAGDAAGGAGSGADTVSGSGGLCTASPITVGTGTTTAPGSGSRRSGPLLRLGSGGSGSIARYLKPIGAAGAGPSAAAAAGGGGAASRRAEDRNLAPDQDRARNRARELYDIADDDEEDDDDLYGNLFGGTQRNDGGEAAAGAAAAAAGGAIGTPPRGLGRAGGHGGTADQRDDDGYGAEYGGSDDEDRARAGPSGRPRAAGGDGSAARPPRRRRQPVHGAAGDGGSGSGSDLGKEDVGHGDGGGVAARPGGADDRTFRRAEPTGPGPGAGAGAGAGPNGRAGVGGAGAGATRSGATAGPSGLQRGGPTAAQGGPTIGPGTAVDEDEVLDLTDSPAVAAPPKPAAAAAAATEAAEAEQGYGGWGWRRRSRELPPPPGPAVQAQDPDPEPRPLAEARPGAEPGASPHQSDQGINGTGTRSGRLQRALFPDSQQQPGPAAPAAARRPAQSGLRAAAAAEPRGRAAEDAPGAGGGLGMGVEGSPPKRQNTGDSGSSGGGGSGGGGSGSGSGSDLQGEAPGRRAARLDAAAPLAARVAARAAAAAAGAGAAPAAARVAAVAAAAQPRPLAVDLTLSSDEDDDEGNGAGRVVPKGRAVTRAAARAAAEDSDEDVVDLT